MTAAAGAAASPCAAPAPGIIGLYSETSAAQDSALRHLAQGSLVDSEGRSALHHAVGAGQVVAVEMATEQRE